MTNLKELKERIEEVEIDYDYEKSYHELYNIAIDYMNETQDWSLEDYFNEIIDYELAEEIAKREIEQGGLIRLYYFLGDANLNNELFRIDGYGNLEDLEKSDLDYLKETLLEEIENKINEESEVE